MDIQEVKAQLPVTFVLHARGLQPEAYNGNDILYRVPWRTDNNPSLACYKSSNEAPVVDRWKDMAGTGGGDVLDLILHLDSSAFNVERQLEIANRMLQSEKFQGWVAPQPVQQRKTIDLDAHVEDMKRRQLDHDNVQWGSWAVPRQDAVSVIDGAWIHERFQVAATDWGLVIPYLDEDGEMLFSKTRKYDDGAKPHAPAGASMDTLYGRHLDDGVRPVVLCEGESDVWSGTHATEDYVFLGLPSGAGSHKKVESLPFERRVLIALDGDPKGRAHILETADALTKNRCSVEVVPMPDGLDLSSVDDIPSTLARSRPFLTDVGGLVDHGNHYRRVSNDPDKPGAIVSDFVIEPVTALQAPDGALSHEVKLDDRTVFLSNTDIRNHTAFAAWADRFGHTWIGTARDTGALKNRLAHRSIACPHEIASPHIGLYAGQFVWKDGSIGTQPIRWVPQAMHHTIDVRLSRGGWDLQDFLNLLELGDPRQIHPILAWGAAAPLRSLFHQFPYLAISGEAGSGKSKMVEEVLPRLTGSYALANLASGTTSHGATTMAATTNAFPVYIDEYRQSAKQDTLDGVKALLRASYGAQEVVKGGMNRDNYLETTGVRIIAPVAVVGEQSTLDEESTRDRAIVVKMPSILGERNPDHVKAYNAMLAYTGTGMAHSYLSWLQEYGIRYINSWPEETDRVAFNLHVLKIGWDLLEHWLEALGYRDVLPEPDWSGHLDGISDATDNEPIRAAIEWAADMDHIELVWQDEENTYVQVTELYRHAKHDFILPGKQMDLKNSLVQRYGAVYVQEVPPYGDGKRKKVFRFPTARMVD